MPVSVQRRCAGPCHRMLDSNRFRITRRWTDNKGKKHIAHDTYCNDCAPKVGLRQRRADVREPRIPDR